MLSATITELRRNKGLTQAALAGVLQVSRQAYSFYEMGKYEMDLRSLCKLADFYGVTADYLLGRPDGAGKPLLIDKEDEIALVKGFQILDKRGQGSVKATLAFELSQVPVPKGRNQQSM
ncbi:MAG: helix-turn-helix transcriptional regulator [Oscillospiraceae bacterium]|nr:helix-turn-helix transcriptional regulator [Oscillospiraceae bacterium]